MPLDRSHAQATVQKNSNLTSRRNFRCKWGATEKLQIPPIEDFSPPSAVGKTRILSRALRPARRMGTDGACAWELPSAHKIHFRGRAGGLLPPGGGSRAAGGGECVKTISAQAPVRAQTSLHIVGAIIDRPPGAKRPLYTPQREREDRISGG